MDNLIAAVALFLSLELFDRVLKRLDETPPPVTADEKEVKE